MNDHTLGMRRLLEATVLPELRRVGPYFSRHQVVDALAAHGVSVKDDTLKWYLWEMKRDGLLHGAGRGWYSSLPHEPALDRGPIDEAHTFLRTRYPLLDVSLWSTLQLNPWLHHLVAEGVLMVSTDRDMLTDVAGTLEEAGWKPVVNPAIGAGWNVAPGPQRVLIRPRHSAAPPSRDGQATPEQILVDFAVELKRKQLSLMDLSDFQDMACRLASESRINVSTLLRYSQKHRMELPSLFGANALALFPGSAKGLRNPKDD